ncbi:MAG TPA: cytidylate kinase-like family protein [Paludibacteraceae bacterium]|nr:cytidylate kinase-like family protein [Paludibacteraceae bacterium]HOJ65565.1 cytidylate kinase-like family protein [Paludibacteraceae bacterium]HON01544.1 cytidylate kinase-like family protein [Paludibacteraceae bacterium]HPD58896.1 cytidylate kinase-like family protein [Paludibacteraceae bacterium]HPQ12148.1 cytidylate kinase-like family protein [Paludibacteraceae bacterium]
MNQRFVINIGRQLGSGGHLIGQGIARELGISFYDKELIQIASQESGLAKEFLEQLDEKKGQGFFRGMFGLRNSIMIDEYYFNDNYPSSEMLFKIQSDVIRSLAEKQSCVFVGRCADYVLKDHPRAVNIFITADLPDRIARVCRNQKMTEEKAMDYIKKMDKKRADYYNYYTDKQWGAAASYHLCINSSALGIEETISYIIEFVEKKLHFDKK